MFGLGTTIGVSLGTLLLVVTIVCLATALMLEHRRLTQIERQLAETKRELSTLQPLSAEEVARQFENATTLGPISTTVKDVRTAVRRCWHLAWSRTS